jgi:CheY-like chemotaxis protein
MVIETFRYGPAPVYARAADRGRMLPPGLTYLDSWVDERRGNRCFQLMETDDPALFDRWTASWSDLVEFEVVPVIGSGEAAERAGAVETATKSTAEVAADAATILLTEDEPHVRDLVTRMLERLGYRVATASSAEDAIELFGDPGTPVDVLLTDMVLPGLSGRELAGALRTHRPQLRVLFMSGYTEETVGVADADTDFLTKPFTLGELGSKLQQLLARTSSAPGA